MQIYPQGYAPEHQPQPVFTASQIRRIARTKLRGRWKQIMPAVIVYVILSMLPEMLYAGSYILDITNDPEYYESLLSYVPGAADTAAPEQEFSAATSFLSNFVSIYKLLLTGVFSIGISSVALRTIRGEEVTASEALTGFNHFGQSFCTGFLITIYKMLWTFVFILPGSILFGIGATSALLTDASSIVILPGAAAVLAGLIAAAILMMRYGLAFFIATDERNMRASYAITMSVVFMRGKAKKLFLLFLSFTGWFILASIPLFIAYFIIALSGSITGGVSAALFMVIFIVSHAAVVLYMKTSCAVYYSTVTGNFRTDSTGGDNF